jgi:predicted transcriptional regulator YheO
MFTLKRAVPRVAEHFGLSRANIYSYLNEITEPPRRVEPLLRRGPD